MGLGLFRSSCNADGSKPTPAGNPDPKRYSILRLEEYARAVVVEAHYPDARNYEGRKVMVYRCTIGQIQRQTTLDPHFCDDRAHVSPFARFEPTADGWAAACRLAKSL